MIPGDEGKGLVGPNPWSVDPCWGYGISNDFNKLDRLGFGRMRRSG